MCDMKRKAPYCVRGYHTMCMAVVGVEFVSEREPTNSSDVKKKTMQNVFVNTQENKKT